MTYGVVGTSVYADVVQGATQLMGQVNEGRRGIEQARHQKAGLDFQREKFEYQKTQDQFDNTMDMIAAGLDPSKMEGGLPGAEAARAAQQATQQAKSVNSLQALLDDSQSSIPTGTGFDPVSMDNYLAQQVPVLNTDNREGFVLDHVTTPNGTRLITDAATYEGMVANDPEMAQWFSVAGAAPDSEQGQARLIDRETMGRLLGQEISSMPTSTPAQARAQSAAWEAYRNSAATSGTARVYETDRARSDLSKTARTADKDAQATTRNLVTNDEGLTDNEKTSIVAQADQRSQRIINTAMAAAEEATTPQEVAQIERKMRRDLNAVATETAGRAQKAKEDAKFEKKLVGWGGSNTYNTDAARGPGGGSHKRVVKQAADASKDMSKRVAAHGRDAYLREFGDTEQNERAFNQRIMALEGELITAMRTGRRINADLYAFANKYAPNVVKQLQSNGVPQFRDPVIKTSDVEPLDLGGLAP
jgi:hypothetical protein